MRREWPVCAAMALVLLGGCSAAPNLAELEPRPDWVAEDLEVQAALWFEAHRHRPTLIRAFLQRMPKGGDIHTHLGGAVYAETYIDWAMESGLCLDTESLSITQPPCNLDHGTVPLAESVRRPAQYAEIVDALSTRGAEDSGHDQFFSTFGRFRGLGTMGGKLAEVLSRAEGQHVQYMEIMLSLGKTTTGLIGDRVGLSGDLARTRERLLAAGLDQEVARARTSIDVMEATAEETLRCHGVQPRPGCTVLRRYIQSVNRTLSPAQTFAGLVLSFELAHADHRVAGINLVGPEDHPVALEDYTLHMGMVAFLKRIHPDVNVSLHAGELTLGLVPPRHLRFHIRDAVEVAGAQRVGHGTDLAYETDAIELLAELAQRRVLMEISLTSSDTILGVRDGEHPLQAYLEAGVPVALMTDDEGVLRTDLSHEYYRAATTYGLDYVTLKTLARNSLAFSFLDGIGLWSSTSPPTLAAPCANIVPGTENPSRGCADLLSQSERARVQWRLEQELREFEGLPWLH